MKTRASLGIFCSGSKNPWMGLNRFALFAILIAWAFVNPFVSARDVLSGQRDQFAGTTCQLQCALPMETAGEKIAWRLMSNTRTLSKGKSTVRLLSQAKEGPSVCCFDFQTPELNQGMAIDAQLFFNLNASNKSFSVGLVIHHADVFAGVNDGNHRIAVIDPDGNMAAKLEGISLDARLVSRLSGIQNEECIIVGEGIRWEPHVARAIADWINLGRQVIVLRTELDAAVDMPWRELDLKKMEFRQLHESRWEPTTLDTDFWQPTNRVDGWRVSLASTHSVLTPLSSRSMLPNEKPQLWQVAEFQTKRNGICLFVGVPVMERWDQSPTPRLLLKHLLAEIERSRASQPKQLQR